MVLNRRCKFCGQYFRPHPRLGDKQKSCQKQGCQKKRQWENLRSWRQRNPDYFRGRYSELKSWREQNPGYQRQWRARQSEIQKSMLPKRSIKSVRLVVPVRLLRGEIQNSIWLVSRYGDGFWAGGAVLQDTKVDSLQNVP